MKHKELVGYCPVDSGQLMIIDPCYIHEWNDEYDDENSHYRQICDVTTLGKGKDGYGEILGKSGVASQTGYGDGRYPVYAERNREGKIIRLTIEFDEREED